MGKWENFAIGKLGEEAAKSTNEEVNQAASGTAWVCSSSSTSFSPCTSERQPIGAVWGFHGAGTKPSGVRNVLWERSLLRSLGANSVAEEEGSSKSRVLLCLAALFCPLFCILVMQDWWMKENPQSVFFPPLLLTSSKVLVGDYWPPALVLLVSMPPTSLRWKPLCLYCAWVSCCHSLHRHTNSLWYILHSDDHRWTHSFVCAT